MHTLLGLICRFPATPEHRCPTSLPDAGLFQFGQAVNCQHVVRHLPQRLDFFDARVVTRLAVGVDHYLVLCNGVRWRRGGGGGWAARALHVQKMNHGLKSAPSVWPRRRAPADQDDGLCGVG